MLGLRRLIGRKHELAEVARELRGSVRSLGASIVGGFHVTCSDESEHECSRAFERGFAQELLPRLRYGERVPFRIANPGARYEWGSVRIAESHFATPQARQGFLAMVVKINGHVAVVRDGARGRRFGRMARYETEGVYCGAIDGLLSGSPLPFVEDLRLDFQGEDTDRLEALAAAHEIGDGRGMLFGALAAARLQARKCVIDIQDYAAAGPTLWIVLHGVSLNEPGHDKELMGGVYVLDHRGRQRRERYLGLGDDPGAYRIEIVDGRLGVTDPEIARERAVRDHRDLAAHHLGRLGRAARQLGASNRHLLEQLHAPRATAHEVNRALLKLLVGAVSLSAPLAGALVMAAEGAAEVHHLWQLERSRSGEEKERLARRIVDGVHARIDRLPSAVAERVGQALLRELGGADEAAP